MLVVGGIVSQSSEIKATASEAADKIEGWLQDAGIDKAVRGGDKPSDHVPVWVEIAA